MVSTFFTQEQLPSYIVTTPLLGLYLACVTKVATTLTRGTKVEIPVAKKRKMSWRECHVLYVRALSLLGSTSGNHGEGRSILPYWTSRKRSVSELKKADRRDSEIDSRSFEPDRDECLSAEPLISSGTWECASGILLDESAEAPVSVGARCVPLNSIVAFWSKSRKRVNVAARPPSRTCRRCSWQTNLSIGRQY
jgi:hypothetical protein